MNILILGGGGREHALAWAFAQNPKCDRLWCAPGNAGIAEEATCVALDILDGDGMLGLLRRERRRLRDGRAGGAAGRGRRRRARARRHPRPSGRAAAAARLEASKAFTKEICAASGAPTAASQTFTDPEAGARLCRGRGRADRGQGRRPRRRQGRDGGGDPRRGARRRSTRSSREGPGARVVIEEFMAGEEASLFVLARRRELPRCSAARRTTSAPSTATQGPNTGGMGAYSPAPVLTPR